MKKSIKTVAAAVILCALFIVSSVVPAFAADKYVKVNGEPVVVRKDAGKSNSVIAKTHKGEEYEYLSEKKDSDGTVWYQIKLKDGKTGYMTSKLSAVVDKSASQPVSGKTVEIIGEPVVVRTDAGTANKVIAKVHKGNKFSCLDTKNDKNGKAWYKIEYSSGKTGWVMGSLTKLTDGSAQPAPEPVVDPSNKTVEIIGEPVVVRADAGTSNKVIAKVHKGNKFSCLDTKNDKNGKAWYKIEYASGKTGWVMGSLTKLTDGAVQKTKKVEITGNPVNVRADAGLSAKKIGSTSKGKTFDYLDSKKDKDGKVWYKIQYNDKTVGWVLGTLGKIIEK